ncbi:uncharacterized protein LOC124457108 [Xenia sp. Carnegie-2017]|uniref:uncharacterized protein LOC124457108 n=1 Tax=Xenia sp. Carnegie-2017 TaxID=2897299 RepID=UPI001F049D2D|nr:uncharacterized protein LOC124457108 [Xenia sp. Carnegie-2017]
MAIEQEAKIHTFKGIISRVTFEFVLGIRDRVSNDNQLYEAAVKIACEVNVVLGNLEWWQRQSCDGLRDPPSNWFILGNGQGRNQRSGIIGDVTQHIHESLEAADNIEFKVHSKKCTTRQAGSLINETKCKKTCQCLNENFGRWKNNTWQPFYSDEWNINLEVSKTRPKKVNKGYLFIYGDSVSFRFWGSIKRKDVCRSSFKACRVFRQWIYPIGNTEFLKMDDYDFCPNIVIYYIKKVLGSELIKRKENVFMLNFGLHYVRSVNFTTFKKLVDDVIVVLQNRTKELKTNATFVWKTTTAIRQGRGHNTAWRFYTQQRLTLFDAYAMSEMCKAGFYVADVFPLSASYLPGPFDSTHYRDNVFESLGRDLELFSIAGLDYQPTRVCIE